MEGATTLTQAQIGFNTAAVNEGAYATVILQPTAGVHTYFLQATRVGTGTVTMAAATIPAYILVEDIGT